MPAPKPLCALVRFGRQDGLNLAFNPNFTAKATLKLHHIITRSLTRMLQTKLTAHTLLLETNHVGESDVEVHAREQAAHQQKRQACLAEADAVPM